MALRETWPRLAQIGLEMRQRFLAHGHETVLAALARDAHDTLSRVEPGEGKVDEFRYPQARGVHQFEHRTVAQTQRCRDVGSHDQGLDLALGERLRQAARHARPLHQQGRVFLASLVARALRVEAPERGLPPRHAAHRDGLAAMVGGKVVAPGGVQRAAACFQPARQLAQIAPVRFERAIGEAILGPDAFDEAFDEAIVGGGRDGFDIGHAADVRTVGASLLAKGARRKHPSPAVRLPPSAACRRRPTRTPV